MQEELAPVFHLPSDAAPSALLREPCLDGPRSRPDRDQGPVALGATWALSEIGLPCGAGHWAEINVALAAST